MTRAKGNKTKQLFVYPLTMKNCCYYSVSCPCSLLSVCVCVCSMVYAISTYKYTCTSQCVSELVNKRERQEKRKRKNREKRDEREGGEKEKERKERDGGERTQGKKWLKLRKDSAVSFFLQTTLQRTLNKFSSPRALIFLWEKGQNTLVCVCERECECVCV